MINLGKHLCLTGLVIFFILFFCFRYMDEIYQESLCSVIIYFSTVLSFFSMFIGALMWIWGF